MLVKQRFFYGDPSNCPAAQADDSVCQNCEGKAACRAALLKNRDFDMKKAREEAQNNALGSLAWGEAGGQE